MKHTIHTILLFLFAISSGRSAIQAAHPVELPPPPVPLRWTVETSRAQVAQFEAYRGETLLLEATMQSYGKPYEEFLQPDLYWQTNGMGSAWWKAPATASGNVLKAYWSPTNDCGGTVYNCFIGGPDATYRAAFRLRMLPSPGYRPNTLLPPSTTLEESDPVFREWVRTNDFSSAGTSNYNDMTNKPILNGFVIEGSKWSRDYGLADYQNLQNVQTSLDQHLGDFEGFLGYVDSELATKEELSTMQQTQVTPLHDQVNSLGDHYNEISGTVSAWQTYWDGDEVRVTVTNYYGSKDIPSLYIEQKMPADADHSASWFKTIWDERTRWNGFLPAFASLTNDVAQNKADRAWGIYDSSTGAYSPDGLLQLSQDQIMIASGMAWQKTVTTGGGSVWILTATTPFVMSGESTNGFFKITDGDGHALFEIVKGDKQIVPATPTSCVKYIDGFSVGFSVDSIQFQHPVGEVAPDVDGPYVPEDSLDGLSVTWNGESGYWVATVTATPPHAMPKKMFFRATYESGGNTYIRNNVATSIDKVVVGGIEYTVTVETVNGKKLLVLQ